jgi:hypothetical protein
MSTIDKIKNNEIKNNWNKNISYYLYYIIKKFNKKINSGQFFGPISNNKKNHTMIKLLLMISYMSFITNEWNVSHHVLNNYWFKQFVHNDFKAIDHFCSLWLEY